MSVEKCVEIKGDYVEKQQSCFISVTLKSFRPDIQKPRQMENAVRDIQGVSRL